MKRGRTAAFVHGTRAATPSVRIMPGRYGGELGHLQTQASGVDILPANGGEPRGFTRHRKA